MSAKPFILIALIAGIVLLPAPSPVAVTQEAPPDNANGAMNSATLNEEDEVADLIDQADRESSAGNWEDAVLLYQAAAEMVLSEYPSCVFKASISTRPGIGMELYVSAYEYCRAKLLQMDADTLKFYRSKYERTATDDLNQALEGSDLGKIFEVGERYPCTESGLRGLIVAGGIAAERGDMAFAGRCFRKAVAIKTAFSGADEDARPDYALLLAGAARVYAQMGWYSDLEEIKGLLAADAGLSSFEIIWCGSKVTLGAFIDERFKSIKQAAKTSSGYPMVGGDASRALLMPGMPGALGGVKWRYEMPISQQMKEQLRRGRANMLPSFLCRLAAVGEGKVVASNGRTTMVLDENDGRELYKFPVGVNVNPQYDDYYLDAYPVYHSATIYDGMAYAGVMDPNMRNNRGIIANVLYGIDILSGKQVWDSVKNSGLARDDSMSGSPVVVGGKLVFVTHKGGGGQIDCYMNCVDAKTGKLEWRCYVASGFTNANFYGGVNQFPDIVAVDGSTAIVSSVVGVIAAVDVKSGQLMWAAKYEQDFNDAAAAQMGYPATPRRWCFNYPIAVNGHVIVQPADSTKLYCLNAVTGAVKWVQKITDMCYLAGVDDGKVFVLEKAVMIIDERSGKLLYRSKELPTRPAGRPALTKTDLYISTVDSLLKFDRRTQELTEVLKWAEKELSPGNLVFTEEGFYVVNAESIAAFNAPGLVDKLTTEIEKDPNNAALRYRRGEALLAEKHLDQAVADFEKALALAVPDEKYRGQALRDMVGEGLYQCYTNFSAKCAAENNRPDALKYANLAVKYAVTDGARAAATLNLAGVNEGFGDEQSLRSAVACYENMILDLPEYLSKFGGQFDQSASFFAANRIDALISGHGRGLYSDVEASAAKALAEAAAADSAESYLKVHRRYPNSVASLEALMRLAKKHEERNSRSMALLALSAGCARFIKQAESVPANLMLYRIATDAGDYGGARNALDRLSAMPQDLQAEVGGKMMLLSACVLEKAKELDALAAAPAGARIGDNPQELRNIKLDDISMGGKYPVQSRLLVPEGRCPAALAGKLLVARNGSVECWNPETGEKTWASGTQGVWMGVSLAATDDGTVMVADVVPGSPAAGAGLQSGDIIVSVNGTTVDTPDACRQALAALKPKDAIKVAYTRNGAPQEAQMQLARMPDAIIGNINAACYTGDGNLIVKLVDFNNQNREIRCIDGKTGYVLWSRNIRGREPNPGIPQQTPDMKDILTFVEIDGAGAWINRLEPANGKVAVRILIEQKSNFSVVAGEASVNVMETNPYVCHVYDLLTGAERCRIDALNYDGRGQPILAGNLLLFTGEDRTMRVIDIRNGVTLYSEANADNRQIVSSGRYLVVYKYGAQEVLIFDSDAASFVKAVNPGISLERVVSSGDRVCIAGRDARGGATEMASVYDARTGKIICGNMSIGDNINNIVSARLVGDYFVAAVQKYNQQQGLSYTVKVFDITNGKEVYSYTQDARQQQQRPLDATVVDGKLCVAIGDEVKVIK